MAITNTHECAARDCTRMVDDKFLMCPQCWRLVSPETAREVYRTWEEFKKIWYGNASGHEEERFDREKAAKEYNAARQKAIAEVIEAKGV